MAGKKRGSGRRQPTAAKASYYEQMNIEEGKTASFPDFRITFEGIKQRDEGPVKGISDCRFSVVSEDKVQTVTWVKYPFTGDTSPPVFTVGRKKFVLLLDFEGSRHLMQIRPATK